MGSRKKLILGIWATCLIAFLFLGNSANPPNGYTGAPGDNLCTSCHSNPPPGVNGNISLTGLPSTVNPNTTYTLTLSATVTTGSAVTGGFQLVALNASNQNAGDLMSLGSDTGTDMVGGREYIEHRGDKNIVGGVVSWDFNWTSPASGSGTLTLYASANLSNNNQSTSGDRILSNSFTTTLQGGGPALTVSIASSTNVSCFGGNNGSATAQASGGQPPYTFSWSNGQSGPTASNLTAGFYTVTATDALGATATASVTISQPPVLVASIVSQSNVTCFGGNNGAAVAGASGGTPPYSYSWSNGGSGPLISSLTAGVYTVTVTDSKSCVKTATVVITQPALLVAQVASQTNVDCFGNNTGSVTINPLGGTPPYSFSWSNGMNGPVQTNLPAGTFTVTLSDSQGCTDTETVTISQPPQLLATIASSVGVDCHGAATGSATAVASGGVSPYAFSWSNGGTTATASGLVSGPYTVTITDGNDCTATAFVLITEPPALEVTSVITPPTCSGSCDGSVSVSVSGGVSPHSFAWSGGGSQPDTMGLCAGSYLLTVTDANGCTSIDTFDLQDPAPVEIIIAALEEVDCNGNSTGSVAVAQSGGLEPLTWLWSTGDTTNSLANLSAGVYTVTATDANSCSGELSVSIGQPALLTAGASATAETGNGTNDGTAISAPSGGVAPYSFAWSTGDTTSSITGLAPGAYTVTVSDSNLCLAVQTVTVNPFDCSLTIDFGADPVSCAGGSDGSVTALPQNGTPPYSFAWSNGGSEATLTGLSAGSYSLTVLDGNNCSAVSAVVIEEPDPLSISVTIVSEVPCFGEATGVVSLLASGGTSPYTYVWGDSLAMLEAGEAFVRSDLVAGNYFVIVNDGNNCESSASFSLTEPEELTAMLVTTGETAYGANDGTASATSAGGTGAHSYQWSTGDTSAVIGGLPPGLYSVTVTDENGCTATAEGEVDPFNCTLILEVDHTDVLCHGSADGTAFAQASNGDEPYAYSWSNGANSTGITGLSPGAYGVTVIDGSGCPASAIVNIMEPGPLVLLLDSLANVTCFGGVNGYVGVSISGGTPGYNFAWSIPGNTGSTAEDLAAGSYSVTVSDANQCEEEIDFSITEPDSLNLQATSTNESSNGAGDGTASVDPIGGTPPYSILWNTGETSATVENLSPGLYTASVTDDNGCTETASVVVNPFNCDLAVTFTVQSVSCFGGDDGVISLAVSGATEPVEILLNGQLWENGTTITGLFAGSYELVISDADFCLVSLSVVVAQPDPVEIAVESVVDKVCLGEETGAVSLTSSGGTGGYTYQWADALPGNDQPARENLPPGVYSVTVSDGNGCSDVLEVEIQEVVLDWLLVGTTPVFCAEDPSGAATIELIGGDLPYEIIWPNGGEGLSQTGLTGGIHEVSITDANGCSIIAQVFVPAQDQEAPNAIAQPLTLYLDQNGLAQLDPSALDGGSTDNCAVSSFTANLNSFDCSHLGSNPVVLTVFDSNNNASSATTTVTILDTIAPVLLCPGVIEAFNCDGVVQYAISYTDNCLAGEPVLVEGLMSGDAFPLGTTQVTWALADQSGNETSCSFSVTVANNLEGFVTSTPSCLNDLNGTATVIPMNGTEPYTYLWDDPASQTDATAIGLAPGSYGVQITDATGCVATASAVVTAYPVVEIEVLSILQETNGQSNGSIDISVSGGSLPYTFEWSVNGTVFSNAEDPADLSAGTYQVVITDANGCSYSLGEIIVDNISSVGEALGRNQYRVWPNPVSDLLWVEWTGPVAGEIRVELVDLTGRAQLSSNMDSPRQQLNVSGLLPGLYWLRVSHEKGQSAQKVLICR